jgi:pimeloyl-ACP methyl ester carboxylesterase
MSDLPRWQTLPEPPAMPEPDEQGYASVNGIRMYYADFNSGADDPVILLHGGMANAGNWANQIPALAPRHRVIVPESRGHGRSTRTSAAFSYQLMASDVLALLDHLAIPRVAVVGWSDGGIVGLQIAMSAPGRVAKLWADGANSNPSGFKDPGELAILRIAGERSERDYRRLSPTPGDFPEFRREILAMWRTEPNFTAAELAGIAAPTAIVAAEHDELIRRENNEEMARLIPRAKLIILPGVSHFALLQDPAGYNAALTGFLAP